MLGSFKRWSMAEPIQSIILAVAGIISVLVSTFVVPAGESAVVSSLTTLFLIVMLGFFTGWLSILWYWLADSFDELTGTFPQRYLLPAVIAGCAFVLMEIGVLVIDLVQGIQYFREGNVLIGLIYLFFGVTAVVFVIMSVTMLAMIAEAELMKYKRS